MMKMDAGFHDLVYFVLCWPVPSADKLCSNIVQFVLEKVKHLHLASFLLRGGKLWFVFN